MPDSDFGLRLGG